MELDPSLIAPEAAALLMLRGLGLPNLVWTARPNSTGKQQLDSLPDEKLFQPHTIRNREMAKAVRALLYLWHGCADDASKVAEQAPEREGVYIMGLCCRQSAQPADAKQVLQQLPGHDIYPSLAKYMVKAVGPAADSAVRRVADIIKLNEGWEPFAFIDLFEQAREAQLSSANEELVRRVLFEEFNLLFRYCYHQTTGVDVMRREGRAKLSDEEVAKRRAAARRKRWDDDRNRREKERARQRLERKDVAKRAGDQDRQQVSSPVDPVAIHVRCPKCKSSRSVPGTMRGQRTVCQRCSTPFVVPGGKESGTPSGRIRIACPGCKQALVFDEKARGQRVQCSKCSQVFVVPKGNASSAA